MFACAHPAIDASIRAPLMLQVVLGLDAKTIASAFLLSPATMGKRLVRAKDKIRQAGIPFRIPGRANWAEVVRLYDALFALAGSPVVAINRALAIAELQGAGAGLETMPEIADDARLIENQPYWVVRADLLARVGATDEARRAYEIAIGLERDTAVRRFLQRRQSALPQHFSNIRE